MIASSSSAAIQVNRAPTILEPDQSRVLLRPFSPGGSERMSRIISRIMSLPEDRVGNPARGNLRRVLQAASANPQAFSGTL